MDRRKHSGQRCRSALDGGTQGEDYGVGDGYNFGMASLVFSWKYSTAEAIGPRPTGARPRAAAGAAPGRSRAADPPRSAAAFDRLQTARDSLATAAARAEAARAAFRIASRKRDEGVINQVEFIDARSTLTRAELNHNLTRFNVLARRAELEYATSAGDLPARSREPHHAFVHLISSSLALSPPAI